LKRIENLILKIYKIKMTSYQEVKNEALQEIQEEKLCWEKFMLDIKDELSISCGIPIKIPDKNLVNIIKRAKKWFYKNYELAVEQGYYYIPHSAFFTEQFKKDRSIVLPNVIFSVYNIFRINGSSYFNEYLYSYSFNQYITYNGKGTYEDLMGFVIGQKYSTDRESYLSKKFTGYIFNELTQKLTLTGEIPNSDLVIEVYKSIKDCALFEEEIFFRYVLALAQKNIAKILGIFSYNLPGNITINYDMIQSEGQDALDKIEEEIKTSEGTDWFFVST
jgi:hypothetical protein